MESFRKLGISEKFIEIIEKAGFKEPSEIQERTIPLALAGKDIIGGSATGSGKTLVFATSIIEYIQRGNGIQALILTPTRELAEQVGKVFIKFSSFKNLQIAIVYGGVGMGPQINALQKSEIVVGTPGRILDHLSRGTINLKKVRILVLDEADRMLDMGFIEDVEKIISQCPKERQTMLFSATISSDIEHIAKRHMKTPINIEVESYVKPEFLEQIYYDVPKEIKFSLLVHLLKMEREGLVMVFCNTRQNTDFVARNLMINGIEAEAIHGGLSQQKRNMIMGKFHSGKVYVLICTDVAARGLDIKGVSHVYNYDIPKTSKEYIHRIGRTARAGKEGIAISLVSERDYNNFRNVLKNPELKIKQENMPQDIQRAKIRLFERREKSGFSRRGMRGGLGGKERGGRFGERRSFGGGRSFERRGGFRGREDHGARGFHSRGKGDRSNGESREYRGHGERRFGSSRGRSSGRGFSRGKFGSDRGRFQSRGRGFGGRGRRY